MKRTQLLATAATLTVFATSASAAPASYDAAVFAAADHIQFQVVAWRRDIHQHPELGNQEVRTSKLIADHLRSLGLEVRTAVAKTGVIAVLRGARSGKVVALRADMDALPVAEQTGLPFASKATAIWEGKSVPVMHACGHDAHVAMLLGAADVLVSMRHRIDGSVVFIFQPAEEGVPEGEQGGAPLLVKEDALANPRPNAIFGIHVAPGEAGTINLRPGAFMAGSDTWEITVAGKQTHAAIPWEGIDAASVAADIVDAFNQITSRQLNVSHAPTVLTIGEIQLGSRHNIIPGSFKMTGTLRTFDGAMRDQVIGRMTDVLNSVEARYGAKGVLNLIASNPVTANDPALAAKMLPTLSRAASGKVHADVDYVMASEDFSAYQTVAPTLFYHLTVGGRIPNHSPLFTVEEAALVVGVRSHVLTALDFLNSKE